MRAIRCAGVSGGLVVAAIAGGAAATTMAKRMPSAKRGNRWLIENLLFNASVHAKTTSMNGMYSVGIQ